MGRSKNESKGQALHYESKKTKAQYVGHYCYTTTVFKSLKGIHMCTQTGELI